MRRGCGCRRWRRLKGACIISSSFVIYVDLLCNRTHYKLLRHQDTILKVRSFKLVANFFLFDQPLLADSISSLLANTLVTCVSLRHLCHPFTLCPAHQIRMERERGPHQANDSVVDEGGEEGVEDHFAGIVSGEARRGEGIRGRVGESISACKSFRRITNKV